MGGIPSFEAGAIPDKQAVTVKNWFWREVICRFGCPAEIVSDNGKEFKRDFAHMLQECHIEHKHTSSHHPRANGAVEKLNHTIETAVTKVCNPQRNDWDLKLPAILLAVVLKYARTHARKRDIAAADDPLVPQVGDFVLIREHNGGKLMNTWERGVYKLVAFNDTQTVATITGAPGSPTWTETWSTSSSTADRSRSSVQHLASCMAETVL